MIKSMTGFGREGFSDETLSIDLELKSVNSRFLDLSIRMPNQFNFLEEKIRSTVKNYLERGRVELNIRSAKKHLLKSEIVVDLEAAQSMKYAMESIMKHTGIDSKIQLADILRNEDVLSYEVPDLEDEYIEAVIINTLQKAIQALDEMRVKEGANLHLVLLKHLKEIEKNVRSIEALSSNYTSEYRDKLTEQIEFLLDGKHPIDDEKLANEIVFHADRADIQEEINRMDSHIKLFVESLESKDAVGKRLDFITQEMLRETNTIGSKSNKDEITRIVIEQKTIIEKIKEQVQNIE